MGTTDKTGPFSNKGNLLTHKTIVVEFVGPPGAGKSTNCRVFMGQLKEKGLQVLTLQEIKDYVRSMNLSDRFLLFLTFLYQRGHMMLGYMAVLALHRIYSVGSIYRYFRLNIFDLVLTQQLKHNRVDIVVLEQWIIQELWSATIFKFSSYSSLIKHLPRFGFKTDHLMYFDIDEVTASARIEMRKTNLSRFDRMEADERLRKLKIYSSYLYQLFESSDCRQKTVISQENSPEENAACFVQQLDMANIY